MVKIPETLEALAVDIDSVRPFESNPRRGDVKAIAESLSANGQYRPIVANKRTGEILAGNHTWQAAKSLGWPRIAVSWVDVDDETASRIVLVDNRLNDLADYDDEALKLLLAGLDDYSGTGYDDDFVADLLGLDEPVALTDVDEAPEIDEKQIISKQGDVWHLGSSLLLVGDSTDSERLLEVMGDERADCVWTDPPYGVNYEGVAGAILNDSSEDLPALLDGAFKTVVAASKPGAPVYVAYSEKENVLFHSMMGRAGILVRQHLVWVKNTLVLGRSDYQYRHEPIFAGEIPEAGEVLRHEGVCYGFTPGGSGRLGRGGSHWFGDNSQTTVFEIPKPPRNPDHPTMKPVELITAMLKNSLPKGGLVLDLFGGSGSTLIAAHHLRSRAVLVELDEKYADAICRRWQAHTGIMPVLDSTGEPVDFCSVESGGGSV